MKTYIGTKVVNAQPLDRQSYNDMRNWTLPEDENGADEGYLVEYTDGGKPNHEGYEGYISWSPKEQFEKAYNAVEGGLDFGQALKAIKMGHHIARAGWNGKAMWLAYSPGIAQLPAGGFWSQRNKEYAHSLETRAATVLPCITMKTATGEILMGWLASQTDMLAEDWSIV